MHALQHLEHLAEVIGPRGSCTAQERQAHDYCQETLAGLGLKPKRDEFESNGSAYRPFILAAFLMLLAYALFHFQAILPAAILATVVTISAFLELAFLSNPLRWLLPKKTSQNVYAIASAGEHPLHKIALVSHVDSHRTPWIWKSPATYKIYRLVSTLGMLAFVGLTVIFVITILAPNKTLQLISPAPALVITIVFVMTLQAEMSPYTNGANDNASGVALLLDLAKRLQREPLAHSEVWFVFTGCEEVGAHGAQNFVRRHREELADATFIVIDNIAGANTVPRYYRSETMLRRLRYPQELIALAEQIAAERPELGARPFDQKGAYTDGTPILLAGLKCLTIVNHTQDGWIPNWHHPADVWANVDVAVLRKTHKFLWEILRQVDCAK